MVSEIGGQKTSKSGEAICYSSRAIRLKNDLAYRDAVETWHVSDFIRRRDTNKSSGCTCRDNGPIAAP